jgi:hypothetical protein
MSEAVASSSAPHHPVDLIASDDLRRSRVTTFFRLALAVPHLIWLSLWGIAATIVVLIAWFVALLTARVPTRLHDFLAAYLRYLTRVTAYTFLLADPFPPFSGAGTYPVDARVELDETQSRLTVLFRIILAIPALLLVYVFLIVNEIIAVIAWIYILFTGRMSAWMENLSTTLLRYEIQSYGYLLLLTGRYPSLPGNLYTRREIVMAAVDARPALPISTSGNSLWDTAARRRDEIAAFTQEFFQEGDTSASVRKSKPGEYPLFVAVDSWVPVGETDVAAVVDRSFLSVTISVEPYRQEPLLYEVKLEGHGKRFRAKFWDLTDEELQGSLAFLLNGGEKPEFFRNRARFLRPQPKNKLIKEARAHYWRHLMATCTHRPVVQAIPKQSLRSPRREYIVDSWHVSVPGAGKQFESFKRRIYEAASASDPGIETNLEIHQNWAPGGFVERERMVLSKGQATLHIHVYPFTDDAFVGWDSHLNWRRWAEGDVVSRTVHDKRRVEYKALDVGVHVPTEFDLIEADVLAETTHSRIVDAIKVFLREREIEADLDFKIIRGDRGKALEERKDTVGT